MLRLIREHRTFFLGAALAGVALRLIFVLYFPAITDDSRIYAELGRNWLQHGVYGQQGGGPQARILPTDARLPGYPAFLAAVFWLFGAGNFKAVLLAQVLADMGTCLVIADLARRMISDRAARVAFILAALCPFFASYSAAALTETLEIFFTAVALDCAAVALGRMREGEPRVLRLWAACGMAIGACILLRPDGGILLVAIAGYLAATGLTSAAKADFEKAGIAAVNRCATQKQGQEQTQKQGQEQRRNQTRTQGQDQTQKQTLHHTQNQTRHQIQNQNRTQKQVQNQKSDPGQSQLFVLSFRSILAPIIVVAVFALAPLVPWTLRNFHSLHHFQPLAPRYANETDELVPRGFNRWTRTWIVDYVSVEEIYWNVPGETIDAGKLPSRAFDSASERSATLDDIAEYNESQDITPELDARFGELAADRIRAHAVRYYVVLPVLRIADMWLRPRTELLAVDPRWWEFNDDAMHSFVAVAFGLLNLAYVGMAIAGVCRRRSGICWAGLLISFLLLRSAFLGTLENPEPRYTLEGYPAVIVLVSSLLARRAGF